MAVKVPTLKNVEGVAKRSLVNGAIGGVAVGFGARILGPVLGPIVGGIVAGAAVGDDVIAKNAVMDAVAILFLGGGEW